MDEPTVHGYVRASTRKQEISPEAQQEAIRSYCIQNKLPDPSWYIDAATSGKIPLEGRGAGGALMENVRRGDHVVISKLDRMFRSLRDCVVVMDRMERLGVNLHVCNMLGGAIDLGKPIGKFIIHVLAAFAELERSFIAERTKDALMHKKRRGEQYHGQARYGFKWQKVQRDGRTVKVAVRDDEEREVMRQIVAWRAENPPRSWHQIYGILNYDWRLRLPDGRQWSESRIKRAWRAEMILQIRESSEK